jgi:hypothetical protein
VSRFNDERSKEQIALFRLHELHASRWRNSRNLARWNDSCRQRWELAQIRVRSLIIENPDTFVAPAFVSELPIG